MNGAGRFDSDVALLSTKFLAELAKFLEDHWLSPGDHNVSARPLGDFAHDGFNSPRVPFRFPGSVSGIAKPTTQIASAGSNKDAGSPRKSAFPLDAMKNL